MLTRKDFISLAETTSKILKKVSILTSPVNAVMLHYSKEDREIKV